MTQMLNLISVPEKQEILEKLSALQEVCCPVEEIARPTFQFKTKKDFIPVLDDFHCGSFADGYKISPDQLKTYFYEDRKDLKDRYVDFIKTKELKWYYNTSEKTGNFFSEDGQKKVEVEFNFWVDAKNLWSVPGLRTAMRQVLEKCSGDTFPTQTEAESFFDDELCRKIYNRMPSFKAVKQAVVELVEPFRKALVAELVKTKSPSIILTQGFKKYAKENYIDTSKPVPYQVKEYLKKNKNAIYLLGEKFHLIKKANRMIRYQEIRDSVRHPKEVKALLSNARKVYQDFCIALGMTNQKAQQTSLQTFADNTEVFDNLGYMSEILDILGIYEDKKLNKKDPAYWQDLKQKGIVEQDEIPYLQKMIVECNSVAHVNKDSGTSKRTVADEGRLIQISLDMTERHEKKQQQKQAQIQRWIEDNSFSV